jgi:Flp pilus assembly protein TadD
MNGERLAQAGQAYQTRDYAGAIRLCQQVLQTDPFQADALSLLGFTYLALGKLDDAAAACRQALSVRPNHLDAHNALGIAMAQQKLWRDAEASFRQVIRIKPDFAHGYNNLGITLKEQGRLQDADACYRNAIRLDPNSADAFNNLGNVLRDLGRSAEAESALQSAIRLRPNYPEAHHNLGLALKDQGKLIEAEAAYRRAISLQPGYTDAYNNLGNVLNAQGRFSEAEACYHEALRHQPRNAEAHSNLGVMLTDQGRLEEAASHYTEAIRVQPDYAGAHYNFAMHLLLRGDFARGWKEYEWRWRVRKLPPHGRPFTQPLWDGSPLNGRTILLHSEQGLGDMIQFVRYATVASERGGTVIMECQRAIVPLLAGCRGVDRAIPEGSPLPHFDFHAPLMSLPSILGTTVETIPASIPYLSADPARVERWGRELSAIEGLKVGIVWRGNANNRRDHARSFGLDQLAPVAEVDGVRLISLQKGADRGEVADFAAKYPLVDWTDRLDEGDSPFLDTAAVMKGLDLVVSADTAPCHLAGALGVPVWVALPLIPDWRWLLNRDDSPWYPTARLIRQTRSGDWADLFERMAKMLAQRTERGIA